MPNPRIQKFYAHLPIDQQTFLVDFEAAHPLKILDVGGVTWTYCDSGPGEQVLLLLHGGFVDFDMWIHQIADFEADYRVIAPTCPVLPQATMRAYASGVEAILRAEGVDAISVMGYSEGGLIAQCFLRQTNIRVHKVVLAHTFPPSRESRYYRYDFNLFRVLPPAITAWIFRTLAKPDREELEHDSTEWLDWFQAYFKELKSRLTKDKILTHIDLMMDFVRNYVFQPADLVDWEGQMLLTVAQDDVVKGYFEVLKTLYPRAETHVFPEGLGAHSLALISPQIFNARIRAFLEGR